jgi:hypothetical protein
MKTAGLLLTILLATGLSHTQDYLNCKFAPGWEQSEAKHQYASDNLWEYKDGAAEGYLQYGFARMQGISCKSGGDTLSIDVSEMTDADSAYGIFVANSDPNLPVVKIGMGGQVQPQSANFTKGKYYVELVVVAANPNSNQTATLEAFAGRIEALLEGRTTVPEALEWFPKEGLTSTRLVPESVLGLRLLKRGYQAKYRQGQAFIVQEASPESAADVLKKLREKFEGVPAAQVADEAFQAKAQYLGGICIFRKGRYLGGYANLPDSKQAVTLAAKLADRIP